MKILVMIKFVFFFYKGLGRNFKIIGYGRQVPEVYITGKIKEKYSFANGIRSIGMVVRELRRELLMGGVKKINFPLGEVVFCGASANNEREFRYFSEIFSSLGPSFLYVRENNISFVEQGRSKRSAKARRVFLLIFFLSVMYLLRIKMCPVSYKYLVSYARLFGWVYLSSIDRADGAKLAVVANDHTDFPVVFSMIMQLLGVKVLYVQHAEVTERFPGLDFDFSILRNERSRKLYELIAPMNRNVFVIPRVFELLSFHKLFACSPDMVRVVIYLSSVFSEAQVCRCVNALKKNPNITSVSIKRHPRVPAEIIQSVVNVDILDAVPDYEHVALVPNSSVAIELLEAGVKVYQYFPLDDMQPDYYGFVREGITCGLMYGDLCSSFWSNDFYSKNWLPKFKVYSPAVDGEWRAALLEVQEKVGALVRG